jgi:hypothetical protein
MKVVQVDLKTKDGKTLTTWVDSDPRVKEGVMIALKEFPDMKWKVLKRYTTELDVNLLDMNRGWTNNI